MREYTQQNFYIGQKWFNKFDEDKKHFITITNIIGNLIYFKSSYFIDKSITFKFNIKWFNENNGYEPELIEELFIPTFRKIKVLDGEN